MSETELGLGEGKTLKSKRNTELHCRERKLRSPGQAAEMDAIFGLVFCSRGGILCPVKVTEIGGTHLLMQ